MKRLLAFLLCAVMLFSVLGAEAGGVQYAHTYLAASEKTILLEHMPRTDADGNELLYELVPGVTDHYTAEGLPTAKGLDVTLRYLDDHDWSKVRTEPDCEKRGEVVYTCDGCGAINRYTLAPLGHDYAVCEKDGYHLYVCRRCGKWYAETIEAKGHAWGAWIVDTPATSTTRGTKHRVCKRCLQKEIVSIFHRYANYAGYDTSDITTLLGFADALSVSDYARDALSWAVRAGIVNGIEENGINYLQPQGTATRAQAAAIFQRFDAWRLG